jgi:hypothetical protein
MRRATAHHSDPDAAVRALLSYVGTAARARADVSPVQVALVERSPEDAEAVGHVQGSGRPSSSEGRQAEAEEAGRCRALTRTATLTPTTEYSGCRTVQRLLVTSKQQQTDAMAALSALQAMVALLVPGAEVLLRHAERKDKP